MASVASQLIEEVTAHAQSDSLEDAREICADGSYFPNNLRIYRFLTRYTKHSLCISQHGFKLQNLFSLVGLTVSRFTQLCIN